MKQLNKQSQLIMDEKITNFLSSLGYIVCEHIRIKKYIAHTEGAQNKLLDNFKSLHEGLILYFNHRQITRIVSHSGGYNNIQALNQYLPDLQEIGLTSEHVVRIAANNGGSLNIKAVVRHFSDLQKFGFTTHQIIKIAGRSGGSKNITAVVESFIELKKLKYNTDDITKIVGHNGGSRNLYKIIDKHIIAPDADFKEFYLDESLVQAIEELEEMFSPQDKAGINGPILLFSASPIRVESPTFDYTEAGLSLNTPEKKRVRVPVD